MHIPVIRKCLVEGSKNPTAEILSACYCQDIVSWFRRPAMAFSITALLVLDSSDRGSQGQVLVLTLS